MKDPTWRDEWDMWKPAVIACAVALLATIAFAVFTWWCECGPTRLLR